MKLNDFDYHLPRNFIARYPPPNREDARLLHLPKAGEALAHLKVTDLPRHLRPGDLLVLNDTKVNPWRIHGRRESGGRVEALLLKQLSPGKFRAMVRANRPLPEGETIAFDEAHHATIGPQGRERELEFSSPHGLAEWLESFGEMPIPPYLDRSAEAIDKERYQTISPETRGRRRTHGGPAPERKDARKHFGRRRAHRQAHPPLGSRDVPARSNGKHRRTRDGRGKLHFAGRRRRLDPRYESGRRTHPGRGNDGGSGLGIRIYRGGRARPDATGGGVQHPPVHQAGFRFRWWT